MPNSAIFTGVLLILTGVVGYVYGISTGAASFTALIPAAFGLVIALLGAVAKSNEGMRKHMMHAAVIVALIGFIVPAGRVLSKISTFSLSAGVVASIAMAVICLVFVFLCVRSFIAARRDRV